MLPSSHSAAAFSRPSLSKRHISDTTISPSVALPSKSALAIRNSTSNSPNVFRGIAGAKSPIVPYSPPTRSIASDASACSTQRAPSLDVSMSPPSTPTLENFAAREGTDVQVLRMRAQRLEELAKDAQQRLQAETQALQQVV